MASYYPVADVPGLIHIVEQMAEHGKKPKALVECPFCGKQFLKRRGHIRESGHTACRKCSGHHLNSHSVFIEDIPGQLIVLEQYADEHSKNGKVKVQVQCPCCGRVRTVTRDSILQGRSTWCESCNQAGKRSPVWKGGCSGYRGATWHSLSARIRERDFHTCQFPGCDETSASYGRLLGVHHIVPWRLTQDNNRRNLITLCPHHHRWADNHLDRSIPMFDAIISAIYEGW